MRFVSFESDRPAAAPKRPGPVRDLAYRVLIGLGAVAALLVTVVLVPAWLLLVLASVLIFAVTARGPG